MLFALDEKTTFTTIGKVVEIFKKIHVAKVDYMVVCPILNLYTSFKLLKDECRNGLTKLITRKGQNGTPANINQYGLNASHTPYLKLASINPE